jgi:hypothetical protein
VVDPHPSLKQGKYFPRWQWQLLLVVTQVLNLVKALHNVRLCDNILVPLSGRFKSFFPQYILGMFTSKPCSNSLSGDSIEGRIPSSYKHY